MDYAHYSALSEADWLAVKQERLMLDMPLTINWEHMDARLLERFFDRRPQRAQNLFRCVICTPMPITTSHTCLDTSETLSPPAFQELEYGRERPCERALGSIEGSILTPM